MKLEMKSIKHSAFASEETDCYEGYVYVDGKKAIYVSNDGKGGSDRQYTEDRVPHTIIREIDEWCKKNLPKWKMSSDGNDAERVFDGGEMRMPKQEGGMMMYKQKDEDPLAYEKIAQDEIKKNMLRANRAPSLLGVN